MQTISNQEFGGERPLFGSRGLRLEHVIINEGESGLKECADIEAVNCEFKGKYPFWHVDGFRIKKCTFHEGARAALWYSKDLVMEDTVVRAPKMFREMDNLTLKNVKLNDALETLWDCRDIKLENVAAENGDYLCMHGRDIEVKNLRLNGNYAFQYCKNVIIRDSVLNTKDSFWETENVTVYDSEINGEYIGWHSKNLRLINCRLSGTQPLCYAENLVLENCEMAPDCDLAFEYTSLKADVNSVITSVKNPLTGRICAKGYGDIIIDKNLKAPGNCRIEVKCDNCCA